MNIKLLVIGKTDEPYLQAGIDVYVQRLKHYVPFEMEVIPVAKEKGTVTADSTRERESTAILKHVAKADRIVLLDEHGTQHTSIGFSQYMQKQMNAGVRNLVFVIGGAYGFALSVYAAAHDKISLSAMTFNHQMVRLFFVEQLYRAYTILHHEPYHNE